MKRILVLGSDGQLGKELRKQLINFPKEYEVIFTNKESFDIVDFEESKILIEFYKPNLIINCAAFTAVDLCEEQQEKANLINAVGPKNIAIYSKEVGAKIIHISTDYVFDGDTNMPYIETSKPNPINVYGRTKLQGELFIQEHNPKHFILRTAWLYGDGHNFVKTMMRLADVKDQITVVNDQFGSPTSTKELVRAILQLIDSDKYGIYHATCEGYCSWYDLAAKIFELKGIEIDVVPCSSDGYQQKAKRPKFSVLENKNLKDNFNFHFKPWDEALIEYLG